MPLVIEPPAHPKMAFARTLSDAPIAYGFDGTAEKG